MLVQTHNYLYSQVNEELRNVLQHKVLKPIIQQVWGKMLESYGLRQRLEVAKETNSQLLILEAGSGSGSFLQDFADLLEEHHLLQAANLNGLDIDIAYIESTEKRNKQSANWSKINYYQHDITVPLQQNHDLNLEKKTRFDCICATMLVQYLPDAHRHVLRLYDYLKPGGILYLCDSNMTYDGDSGWKAPNPGVEKFGRIATKLVRDLNGDKIVAAETAGWLREAGAEQVQVINDVIQAKGEDQLSLEVLRYYITIVRNVTPVLLKMGLVSQTEHDEIMESVFQVGKTSQAQVPFVHTLARKPLNSQ